MIQAEKDPAPSTPPISSPSRTALLATALMVGVASGLVWCVLAIHVEAIGALLYAPVIGGLTGSVFLFTARRFINQFVEERNRAEEAQSQLAAIVQSCEDAIISKTLDGVIMTWNAGAENIYGYSEKEVQGRPITLLNPPDRPNEIPELLEIVKQGKGINRYETERIRKDGCRLYVSASVSPIKDPAGNIVGASTIARDITPLKRVEEKLRAHASHMETLYAVGQDVGATLSLDEVLERALRRVLLATGFDCACIQFHDANSQLRSHSAAANSQTAAQELDRLKAISDATVARMPDRNQPWFLEDASTASGIGAFYRAAAVKALAVLPLRRSAEVYGMLTMISAQRRDYTPEHCQFLQALAQQIGLAVENASLYGNTLQINGYLQQEIEERKRAENLLADFTAMAVHDLRAPLSNLASIAESLHGEVFGAVNENQKQWLGKMRANCLDLIEHVTQFLDLSKMEAGHIELAKQPADVAVLLRESMLEYSIQAGKHAIDLKLAAIADLPVVALDARRINQVLDNLINNALKFTPAGGRVEIGACSDDPRAITLWVKDSGVGIAKNEIPLIFEKYRQLASGKTSKSLGTGLGLSICKKIVEAHGGVLWVDSLENQGTTFFFSLPAGISAAAELIENQFANLS